VFGQFFKAQALLAWEDKTAEKTKLKKTLQQKFELSEKGMAIFGGEGGVL
jgi:hypothetical protein